MAKFAALPTSNLTVLALLFLALIFACFLWIQELRFYSVNRWNFDIDNGKRSIGLGLEGGEPDVPMSNRTRVFFGYPIILLILILFMLVFALF